MLLYVSRRSGELNVFKHALAANGFFVNDRRVSEEELNSGRSVYYFGTKQTDGAAVRAV